MGTLEQGGSQEQAEQAAEGTCNSLGGSMEAQKAAQRTVAERRCGYWCAGVLCGVIVPTEGAGRGASSGVATERVYVFSVKVSLGGAPIASFVAVYDDQALKHTDGNPTPRES